MNITESLIPKGDFLEVSEWADGVWKRLDGQAESSSPIVRVEVVDKLVREWVKNGQYPTNIEQEDFHLLLGFVWGQQMVAALKWEWVQLTFQNEKNWRAHGVVSPDRSLMILPYAHILECVKHAEPDSKILSAFKAIQQYRIPTQAPGSFTDLMAGLSRILPES